MLKSVSGSIKERLETLTGLPEEDWMSISLKFAERMLGYSSPKKRNCQRNSHICFIGISSCRALKT